MGACPGERDFLLNRPSTYSNRSDGLTADHDWSAASQPT